LQQRLRSSETVTVWRGVAESLRAFGSVFANANLRRLQVAGLGSTVGSWIYGVAIAVYAYHAGGAKLVGLLYFARWGAAALGAPWIGLLADRLPRRRLMVAADLIRAALMAGMAGLAAGGQGIWPIFGLAVLSTITSSAFQPAQGALLPSLVETPEELTAANAVMNTIASVGMFAGPALAGLLLATTSIWVVFTITAGTYLWSALCLLRIPPDARPAESGPARIAAEFFAGFRAIASHPALRVVVGLTAAQTLVAGASEVLLVVLALNLLHAGSAGVGWLTAVLGAGGVLAGPVAAVLVRGQRVARCFAAGVAGWGVPMILLAFAHAPYWPYLMFGLIGAANVFDDAGVYSALQQVIPSRLI